MICHRAFVGALFCASVAAAAGCGRYNTVRVEGIVKLDGAPVSGATVTFAPLQEGRGQHVATGVTNDDGRFRLTTFDTDDGAMPGQYLVTVSLVERVAQYRSKEGGADEESSMPMKLMSRNRNKAPGIQRKLAAERKKTDKSLIPPIYSDPRNTPLKYTVPPRGDLVIELDSKRH